MHFLRYGLVFAPLVLLFACSTPHPDSVATPPPLLIEPATATNAVSNPPTTNEVCAIVTTPKTNGHLVVTPPVQTNHVSTNGEFHPNAGWVNMPHWASTNSVARFHQISQGSTPRIHLSASGGVLDFTVKSQTAHWNNTAFMLGYAPQQAGGRAYVHGDDLQYSFLPLLENQRPVLANKIIVLDPGHGGDQPGARSVADGRCEKEFTLDWALRLKLLLVRQGWTVYLTRTNDADIPISNRVAFAEAHHAALFISLHFNSFPQKATQTGVETYCLTPAGMPSNLVRDPENRLPQPNNAFDRDNFLWAMRIQKQILRSVRMEDGGVRRARFMGVLRNQNRPAVLIEGGYLSNQKEARHIASADYRQKLAEGVAKAFTEK